MQWWTVGFISVIFLCSQNLVSQEKPSVDAASLALTPPMGWNSWDGYGTTINEAQFKANARWMAQHLKPFGWKYVTVDMEWFVANPTAEGNSKTFQYSLDQNGRYMPAVSRFPSSANGAGFKPLADYVHSLGLRFGIHILRGIPNRRRSTNFPSPIRHTRQRTGRILPIPVPGISIISAPTRANRQRKLITTLLRRCTRDGELT